MSSYYSLFFIRAIQLVATVGTVKLVALHEYAAASALLCMLIIASGQD